MFAFAIDASPSSKQFYYQTAREQKKWLGVMQVAHKQNTSTLNTTLEEIWNKKRRINLKECSSNKMKVDMCTIPIAT